MHEFSSTPGRTAFEKGREYLFFSGYAYLGLQHVPRFTALVKEGIDRYGWLYPSARISNTRLDLFAQCEALLSEITGAEDTVLTSSGFLAGRLAISKWKNNIRNLIPYHPAIDAKTTKPENASVFAIDSVDTLHSAITDFSFAEKGDKAKTIIVDDSHGFGLVGENGRGVSSLLPRNSYTEYVITYSLSKAPAVNAGAISCSKAVADELRKIPEYSACTPPSPALLHAFIHGQQLYIQQRQQLSANINYFQQLVHEMTGITFHPQLPIFILPADIDVRQLEEKHIIISSFAYPDPSGKKINRVVLNALHTKSDLERLAEALHSVIGK